MYTGVFLAVIKPPFAILPGIHFRAVCQILKRVFVVFVKLLESRIMTTPSRFLIFKIEVFFRSTDYKYACVVRN